VCPLEEGQLQTITISDLCPVPKLIYPMSLNPTHLLAVTRSLRGSRIRHCTHFAPCSETYTSTGMESFSIYDNGDTQESFTSDKFKEERITQITRIGDKICSLHHVAGRGRKPLQSATRQSSLQWRSIHLSLRLQSNRVEGSFEGPAHRIATPVPLTSGHPAERHRGEGLRSQSYLRRRPAALGSLSD
jgi:hypothetical protein